MNVVMTGAGRFVEVQGTAEGQPFSRGELDDLLGLAEHGIAQIFDLSARGARRAARRRGAGDRALRARDREPGQGARDRRRCSAAPASPLELVPRPADVPEVEETGDTLEENARLKAVALVRRHRPARDRRRHRVEVDALDGAPGCATRALRRRGGVVRRQRRLLLERFAGDAGHRRRGGSRPWRSRAGPTAARSPRSGGRGHDRRRRRGAAGASGTTRCSCPTTATAARSPRCRPRRSTSSRTEAARSVPSPTGCDGRWQRGGTAVDGCHRRRRVRGGPQGPRGGARVPRPRRTAFRRELLAAPELGGRPPSGGGV